MEPEDDRRDLGIVEGKRLDVLRLQRTTNGTICIEAGVILPFSIRAVIIVFSSAHLIMRRVLTNLRNSRKSNKIIGGRGSSKGLINEERLKKSNYVQLGKVTTRRDMISVCILK